MLKRFPRPLCSARLPGQHFFAQFNNIVYICRRNHRYGKQLPEVVILMDVSSKRDVLTAGVWKMALAIEKGIAWSTAQRQQHRSIRHRETSTSCQTVIVGDTAR